MKAKRLVDISITARDLNAALAAWRAASRLTPANVDAGQSAVLPVGDISLSLLAALPDETDGLRSLTISVASLDEAIADLQARRIAVAEAQFAEGGVRSAMIDPGSTHGVPIRLVEEQ